MAKTKKERKESGKEDSEENSAVAAGTAQEVVRLEEAVANWMQSWNAVCGAQQIGMEILTNFFAEETEKDEESEGTSDGGRLWDGVRQTVSRHLAERLLEHTRGVGALVGDENSVSPVMIEKNKVFFDEIQRTCTVLQGRSVSHSVQS